VQKFEDTIFVLSCWWWMCHALHTMASVCLWMKLKVIITEVQNMFTSVVIHFALAVCTPVSKETVKYLKSQLFLICCLDWLIFNLTSLIFSSVIVRTSSLTINSFCKIEFWVKRKFVFSFSLRWTSSYVII